MTWGLETKEYLDPDTKQFEIYFLVRNDKGELYQHAFQDEEIAREMVGILNEAEKD